MQNFYTNFYTPSPPGITGDLLETPVLNTSIIPRGLMGRGTVNWASRLSKNREFLDAQNPTLAGTGKNM